MNLPDPASIRGIIFDLDGTLYRMRWFFRPLLWSGLLEHPLRLFHFLAVRSRFAGKELGSREALLDAVSAALAEKERSTPAAIRSWILDRFYPAFIAAMPPLRFGRPQLSETLRHLRSCGIRLGVLSDYHAVEERLARLRIPIDCFDTVTSCEASGALKPSPRPFLSIAENWTVVPDSVLVVGDRDDTDGEAARRAGMHFLLIGDRRQRQNGTSTATGWESARSLLRAIGGRPAD